MRQPTTKPKRSAARLTQIVELLAEPMTSSKLAEHVGLAPDSMRGYMAELLAEKPRRIHVHKWLVNPRGRRTPVFLAGNEPDAIVPRKKTQAELAHNYRLRAATRPPKVRRDPLVAAFFGPYQAIAGHS